MTKCVCLYCDHKWTIYFSGGVIRCPMCSDKNVKIKEDDDEKDSGDCFGYNKKG